MSDTPLPPEHQALVQEVYAEPLAVKTIATPQPTAGSAIIKVLYAPMMTYIGDVFNGKRKYGYQVPLVPGTSAIGRVAAIGPDAVRIQEGDLVYVDCTIRGRDDQEAVFLLGLSEGGSDGSRKLMAGEWRNGTFAQYAKLPLENIFLLDEKRLCGPPATDGLGYAPEQLAWIMKALVPYGGLRSIGLQPGETIVIAPATGSFGSAGVLIALALGARVIAMGRNNETLAKLKALSPRVETVRMTGDLQSEVTALKHFGKIDAFLDISPYEAQASTHIKSGILSLRAEGRVCFMGGFREDVAIPHRFIMRCDITLRGKWMYSRADNFAFLDLLTTGVLDVRQLVKVVGKFKLEQWEEAFQVAATAGRLGEIVLFTP